MNVSLRNSVSIEDYFPTVQEESEAGDSTVDSFLHNLTLSGVYATLFEADPTHFLESIPSTELEIEVEVDEKMSRISQPLFMWAGTEVSSADKLLYQEIPMQILEQSPNEQVARETPVETKRALKTEKDALKKHIQVKKCIRKISPKNQTWTLADDEKLLTSLRTNLNKKGKKDWACVSSDLNHKFSYKACHRRFERKWLLLNKQTEFWQSTGPVQLHVNHRKFVWQPLELSVDGVKNEFQVVIKEERRNVPSWTPEEDQLLLEGVKQFGKQWVKICKQQKLCDFLRVPDDCLKRYKYLCKIGDSRVVKS